MKPTIDELTKRIYDVCLWKDNSNRKGIQGDLVIFDKLSIEAYSDYIITILNSVEHIPQGARAINNPIIEMGLAIGELSCETKPSTWYSDAPYGTPCIITRAQIEEETKKVSGMGK